MADLFFYVVDSACRWISGHSQKVLALFGVAAVICQATVLGLCTMWEFPPDFHGSCLAFLCFYCFIVRLTDQILLRKQEIFGCCVGAAALIPFKTLDTARYLYHWGCREDPSGDPICYPRLETRAVLDAIFIVFKYLSYIEEKIQIQLLLDIISDCTLDQRKVKFLLSQTVLPKLFKILIIYLFSYSV